MPIRCFIALLAALATPSLGFALSVSLDTSTASPAPVGTVATFTATGSDGNSGTLWYRFRSRAIGQDFHIIKDYGPDVQLDWTANDHEGLYQIEVDVRNLTTGETANSRAYFEMQSRVLGGKPVLTPTSHPLVFLYSAPACPEDARMRVQFRTPDGVVQNTPYHNCTGGLSMNFYLGGLRAQTQYSVHHILDTGSAFLDGPTLTLTTQGPGIDIPKRVVIKPSPGPTDDGVLLQATTASNPIATDLSGNVIWYFPGTLDFNAVGPFLLTRPDSGGYFFGLIENSNGDQTQQRLREYDLTGMTVLDTNAARVSEQLVAMGKRAIGAFHHEAYRLPDGKIVTIASSEKILTDVQGPGPVDVIAEMVIVLNRNLQVVWAWDALDHLDPTRLATLGEICPFGGCPPLFLAAQANDWLHANSVVQTPDGNLLFSARTQDWVIKINYDNGNGDGSIYWKLGKDGDFQINSSDPSPWFSHQHDPQLLPDNATIILLDNGNLRNALDQTQNSRGQVLHLDEQNRVVDLILNADLGGYAGALGAAQALPNGDYHFDLGVLPGNFADAIELDSTGNLVYELQIAAPEYRSFRMRDLYTP